MICFDNKNFDNPSGTSPWIPVSELVGKSRPITKEVAVTWLVFCLWLAFERCFPHPRALILRSISSYFYSSRIGGQWQTEQFISNYHRVQTFLRSSRNVESVGNQIPTEKPAKLSASFVCLLRELYPKVSNSWFIPNCLIFLCRHFKNSDTFDNVPASENVWNHLILSLEFHRTF